MFHMLKHGDLGHRLYIACVDLQLLNLVGLLLHLSMALELLRFSPQKNLSKLLSGVYFKSY